MLLGKSLDIYFGLLLCFFSIKIIETTPIYTIDKLLTANKKKACKFNKIVVFGDSISDDGNLWRLSNYTYPPKPYYKGRFSNGPTWVEYLGDFCHLKVENYAYSGATTDTNYVKATIGFGWDKILVPGIKQEINDIYFPRVKNTSINFDKTLFAVIHQGNDYLDAIVNPQRVVKNLYEQWVVLAKFGAKHIMINDFFDFKYLSCSWYKRLIYSFLSDAHNLAVYYYASRFRREYKNVNLYMLPLDKFWDEMQLSSVKEKLGLTDLTTPCITKYGNNTIASVCTNKDQHFYWDSLHPSTKVHLYIGFRTYQIFF